MVGYEYLENKRVHERKGDDHEEISRMMDIDSCMRESIRGYSAEQYKVFVADGNAGAARAPLDHKLEHQQNHLCMG